MPRIQSVSMTERDGREGFMVEWEFQGFTEADAKFRAKLMTAMRFPTTITTSKVLGVREFDSNDYNVLVFVPTEGLGSAGIPNPIKWAREEFGDRFRG